MTKPIYIIGDIHGAFDRLKNLVSQKDIKDSILICVGDFGIGFKRKYQENVDDCKKLNDFFCARNVTFMTIRGNHDNPMFFNSVRAVCLSHVKLLPDYYSETLNGEKFLFVGGAISVDRAYRHSNISYWADEAFVLDKSRAASCDVLITHSAPSWIGPYDKSGISHWIENDTTLWEQCTQERLAHNELIRLCKPSKSYHGHFHCSSWVDEAECFSTILDIEEIKEHRSSLQQ